MLHVGLLAASDPDAAFSAFNALVVPALRSAARTPLRNARHGGGPCPARTWCADCEETLDTLALNSFTRLRSALAGAAPRTRDGAVVREMAELCEHVTSEQAPYESAAAFGTLLRRRADPAEPRWLRAARAQLVQYTLRCLEERVRRDDAVRRGGAAHPDRDLRNARWAAPLRRDPVTGDLLRLAVYRARRGRTDLFDIPADVRERHGLDHREAVARMHEALRTLRTVRPGFFAANISCGVPSALPPDVPDPAPYLEACIERVDARIALRSMVSRRHGLRPVVTAVCDVASGRRADPVRAARRCLDLDEEAAEHVVRRLVALVTAADPDWADRLAAASGQNVARMSCKTHRR